MNASSPDRFAVIADIHGNSDALRAVLRDIDALGLETIVNLGDHFSGPLAAGETGDILLSRPMVSIRGNHDRWLLDVPRDRMGASDRAAAEQLRPEHLDWLRSLPPTAELGAGVFLCHGTPDSDTTYWMEDVLPDGRIARRARSDIEAAAQGIGASLLLCGHTHTARAIRLSGGRLLVNPGSVGCPGYTDDMPVPHVMESGSPDASYAVVERDAAGWRASFRLVPYDSARMVALAAGNGRQEWADAVATGWVSR